MNKRILICEVIYVLLLVLILTTSRYINLSNGIENNMKDIICQGLKAILIIVTMADILVVIYYSVFSKR